MKHRDNKLTEVIMTKRETRFILNSKSNIEVRSDSDEKNSTITGYAAVFYDGTPDTEYKLFGNYYERIDTSAFNDALQNDDVRALFNHDINLVLGRSTAGTLSLYVDQKGLKYEISVPDTTPGKDLVKSIKRGDITGSSFSFEANGVEWSQDNDKEIRTITKVKLYDVGPVTFPAYQATESEARNEDQIIAEAELFRQEKQQESHSSEEPPPPDPKIDDDYTYTTIKSKGIKF